MIKIEDILQKESFNLTDIKILLNAGVNNSRLIYAKAAEIKERLIGNNVYLRGLIEYSNKCAKNCFYCGIRAGNTNLKRYQLNDDEVFQAVDFAYTNKYASIVIQSGERNDSKFVSKITYLLTEIQKRTNNELGITLSLGEQSRETYKLWSDIGAKRYLLRIETSNIDLYHKIHPNDKTHSFEDRIACLKNLKDLGYQVGTGVMIGLPFQTIDHLANDLMYFKELDIDMCGMGPYISHKDTPLFQYKDTLWSTVERFNLSLKMIAILRIMMKDINIAATTAMQTLDRQGREKAIKVGANIIMPNLTPVRYRENYLLYEDKPCIDEEAAECMNCLEARVHIAGAKIGYNEWGDSLHFAKRKK